MISLVATVKGVGPFARATLNESLLHLQSFMAMAVLTSLFLGAVVAERDRAIALRDDFLALASHELNAPITAIHLDVVALTRLLGRADAPAEKIRHRAEHTTLQVERLRSLATRLLDSTQIAAGRLTLAPVPLDLASVVREVTDRFATQLRDAGRTLELYAPQSVPGRWDRLRLEVIVTNLVANAVKYGEDKPIRVSVVASGEGATLTVQDHGIGIPRDQQARVFERFERAVSRDNYPGLGLGLWITRALVEAMRGRIELTSEPGAGATFTVTLPVSRG
jgi:signal transduction histidine kinase